ncbi:hypothetical protein [Streptomyces sp. WAC06614]|uniref:hypothetical protein n=1 Tax=Streptomyces sp. WAC06614 TaxID=2487416 RepID=UPI000F7B571D|nr:hypothetical protein [Streptomyces sp. WAC06614]RSS76922.1 hypothetical protein EF918_22305 [Streptomyces sp. WAC06614]
MSFEAEWSSARAGAGANVSMRLNQVAPEPGGGGGAGKADLKIEDDHIGAIGSAAFTLHNRLQKDGDHARVATFDASLALTNHNFTSGSALLQVHDRWNSQLHVLVAACANISNHCDYTVTHHDHEERKLVTDINASKINEYLK